MSQKLVLTIVEDVSRCFRESALETRVTDTRVILTRERVIQVFIIMKAVNNSLPTALHLNDSNASERQK
ncbi:hypothetical protein E2C01_100807 [Portunus trituberculatus]|uniref:Uncharacterized protein n=1 Tax=Portunus trituberculatus TaxID=210409 RepID=A0A5B7K430_PORTR|nr:hypothetical protein [Portunus trituberculatus]